MQRPLSGRERPAIVHFPLSLSGLFYYDTSALGVGLVKDLYLGARLTGDGQTWLLGFWNQDWPLCPESPQERIRSFLSVPTLVD